MLDEIPFFYKIFQSPMPFMVGTCPGPGGACKVISQNTHLIYQIYKGRWWWRPRRHPLLFDNLYFYIAFVMQSGQVHFFNTRTQKRTCRDPRGSPEPVSSRTMSLDLELNLPFDSFQDHLDNEEKNPPPNSTDSCSNPKPILSRSLSWVSLDADEQEMLAAVCMRCHMLVMLCKSSPTCPNCKFLNPTDQIPSIKLDSPLL